MSPRDRERRRALCGDDTGVDEIALAQLLDEVRAGRVSADDAVGRLRRLPIADLGFARVDTHRALRQGIPEVVFAPGKTPDEIVAIVGELLAHDGAPIMVTRLDDATVAGRHPGGEYI